MTVASNHVIWSDEHALSVPNHSIYNIPCGRQEPHCQRCVVRTRFLSESSEPEKQKDQSEPADATNEENHFVRRRMRQALSCQRCRKHRSKCSRARPSCEQCIAANVTCIYPETPGDLESTALRSRFDELENQILSMVKEFDLIEHIVYDPPVPAICTDALSSWRITNPTGEGLTIETQTQHVRDIYAAVIRFALDNTWPSIKSLPPAPALQSQSTPPLLMRNDAIYPTVKFSHFASLLYWTAPTEEDEDDNQALSKLIQTLPRDALHQILNQYNTCLLHGSIQSFDPLFHHVLMDDTVLSVTPSLQLLLASCIAYMLLHAHCWHPKMLDLMDADMTREKCIRLANQFHGVAKELLSTLYFEEPSVVTCHAICNLALYHMENGNASAAYLYSGMAARLGSSMYLYSDDALERIAQAQRQMVPALASIELVRQYTHAMRYLLFFLDTNASHFHNKAYELHEDAGLSFDPQQGRLQWLEFQICQITRDIRNTCFDKDRQTVPYQEIMRIEKRLTALKPMLPTLDDTHSIDPVTQEPDFWLKRCYYVYRIRYHGLWILLHQTYLPAPCSVSQCTDAAFALVNLFDTWNTGSDCYFRPCIHELKQACEVLKYHVDCNTSVKPRALNGLRCLLKAVLQTPVQDIARTRPFIQQIQHLLIHDA